MKNLILGALFIVLFSISAPMPLFADNARPNVGVSQTASQSAVTIFCYHQFGIAGMKDPTYSIAPENFEHQMELIRQRGITVVPLSQYMDALKGKATLPEKAAVITIDDGYRNVYTTAYPILKKYGYPFTIFIYTDLISHSKFFLTWEEVAEMARNGVEVGSHSRTHPLMTQREKNESEEAYQKRITEEIAGSKRILEAHLKQPVRFFAYPYGAYDDFIRETVKNSGYDGALTVNPGPNDESMEPYSVNRRIIVEKTSDGEFLAELKTLPVDLAQNSLTPLDGQILDFSPTVYTAMVLNKDDIDPKSLRLFIDGVGRVKNDYLPEQGIIRFSPDKPLQLRSGFHIVTVIARDRHTGATHMGSWSFLIKKS